MPALRLGLPVKGSSFLLTVYSVSKPNRSSTAICRGWCDVGGAGLHEFSFVIYFHLALKRAISAIQEHPFPESYRSKFSPLLLATSLHFSFSPLPPLRSLPLDCVTKEFRAANDFEHLKHKSVY